MLNPILPGLGLNLLELTAAALALGVFLVFLRRWEAPTGDPLEAALSVLAVAAALLFSVAEVSQFMTTDEAGLTRLLTEADRGAGQWAAGALHTTTAIALPIVRLLDLFGASVPTVQMVLKTVHWTVSVLLCVPIVREIARLSGIPAPATVPLLCVAVTLPISQIAYKTFNYDALSMLFGVLATLLVARAWRDASRRTAAFAIVAAALAAQEKLSASPLLMIAIVVGAVIAARAGSAWSALFGVARGFLVALAVSLVFTLLYAVFGPWPPDERALMSFPDLLVNWTWTALVFLGGLTPAEVFAISKPLLLAVSFVAAAASAIVIRLVDDAANRRTELRTRIGRGFMACGTVAPALVVLAGLIGYMAVSAYWAPWVPAPDDGPNIVAVNGTGMHFGAQSLGSHLWRSTVFAYAVVVLSLPTVVWLAYVAGLGIGIVRGQTSLPAVLEWIVAFAAVLPTVFALAGVPGHHRYHNIAIFLLAILAVVRLMRFVPSRRGLLATVFVVLIIAEAAPFQPLQGAFRPIWAHYDDPDQPTPGHLNPSWVGWGEEVMLLGKQLAADCAEGRLDEVGCADLRIAAVYRGLWLGDPRGRNSGWIGEFEQQPTDPDAFIVVNRSAVAQGIPLPPLEPDAVLSFRGFDQAWAYRADRVAETAWTAP